MAHLPGMFLKHGFKRAHLDVVQKIARPGTPMWHWPNAFWQTYLRPASRVTVHLRPAPEAQPKP